MSDNRVSLIKINGKCSCKGFNLDKFLQPNILVLLAHENLHGYLIIQKLEEKKLFMCEKFDSTGVYRTLQAMEKRGLIESYWDVEGGGAAKKIYRIKPDGRTCLSTWHDTLVEYQSTIADLVKDINTTLSAAPKEKR